MTDKQSLPDRHSAYSFVHWVFTTLFESGWAPIAIIFYYIFAMNSRLFRWFPSLDNPSHVVGGMAITYFFYSAAANSQKLVGKIPQPVHILLAFTCAGTTTILWEFLENVMDIVFDVRAVRGLRDTLGDLLFGLSGAFITSLFYSIQAWKRARTNHDSLSPTRTSIPSPLQDQS
jgi:hypothetical protein